MDLFPTHDPTPQVVYFRKVQHSQLFSCPSTAHPAPAIQENRFRFVKFFNILEEPGRIEIDINSIIDMPLAIFEWCSHINQLDIMTLDHGFELHWGKHIYIFGGCGSSEYFLKKTHT